MEIKSKSRRDTCVELLRILACFAVIVTHTKRNMYVGESLTLSRVFIASLTTDSNGIFFCITGFFLFKQDLRYGESLKKFLLRRYLPVLLFTLLMYFFGPSIIYGIPFSFVSGVSSSELKDALIKLITLRNFAEGLDYFWFIYTITYIMILLPIVNLFVCYLDESSRRTGIFMLVSVILLVLNQITKNGFLSVSVLAHQSSFTAAIYMIYGHIIYKYKDNISKKPLTLVFSLVTFISIILIRTNRQHHILTFWQDSYNLYFFSIYGFIAVMSIIIFALSLEPVFNKCNKLSNLINYIASLTFGIYIIHYVIICYSSRFHVRSYLENFFFNEHYSYKRELGYSFVYAGIVFIICAIIISIIKTIMRLIINKDNRTGSKLEITEQ